MALISQFRRLAETVMPEFTGLRVLHMPILHGYPDSWPKVIYPYRHMLRQFANLRHNYVGQVVYLTVDERVVRAGETHRRPGLHVDGWHVTEGREASGGTWGGSGGGWGGGDETGGTGLLTVA